MNGESSIRAPMEPENEYMDKLQMLKEVRLKTIQMEKIKLSITDNLDELKNEEKTLTEYQDEMKILLQEKMALVEELRLIHTDINTMESLIKQSKQSYQSTLNETRSLHESYLPLTKEINEMRSVIGAAEIPDDVNIPQDLSVEGSGDKDKLESGDSAKSLNGKRNAGNDSISADQVKISKSDTKPSQNPPMKTCRSCQQLIHRNAPVCPLCKAKTRSQGWRKCRRR